VRSILRDRGAAIATANLIEVLDVTQRVRGIPIERVRAVIDPLLDKTVAIVALEPADRPPSRRAPRNALQPGRRRRAAQRQAPALRPAGREVHGRVRRVCNLSVVRKVLAMPRRAP
jgi:hypothetical protein